MIKNYILVAVRNLTRHKFFSAINIFGLAISMSICMGIIMLVADQMMYDRYNTKSGRIYRVNTYGVGQNGVDRGEIDNATSPMPLKDDLLENYTGIEKVARVRRGFGNHWLEFEGQNVNVPLRGYFADAEVLDLFEYELQYGDPLTALSTPYSVVVTRSAANKLFKEENPIGKSIKVGDMGTYIVTGVLKETDNKSHLVFEALASMATVKSLEAEGRLRHETDDWMNFWGGWTYILLEPGKSLSDVGPHLEKIYQQHVAIITNPDAYKANFRLQGLLDITPGQLVNNAIGPSLPWAVVYFLSGLASVIMLTSCFNFTSLSIARSLKRAKEIGIRKVTGAARWQIFTQFLSESIVVSFCALILAFIFLIVLKPLILHMTFARVFMWDLEANYIVFGVFLLFAISVGIFAGMFPAVVLSGFEPVRVLKSVSNVKLFSRMGLRKILLVSQFTLSMVFILTVILMYNQLELFLNKDYGFNMKNVMTVHLNSTSAQALKTELLKYSAIKSVAATSHTPAAGTTMGGGFKKHPGDKEWTRINSFCIDEDYLKNMEVELVAGKFFSPENGKSNKNFLVINEEAVKSLQYETPMDAINEEIIYEADSSRKVIIGVVKDYNHGQLMSKIEPLSLICDPNRISLLQVRYIGTHQQASKIIDKAWSTVNPTLKSDYQEMEEEIKFFYNTVFGDLVNILGFITSLAILISCLGLLGMATYTIETSMKEISIRKVLGSTNQALVLLLSRGFIKLIMISILVGVPLAWFINNLWLEQIAYRTSLNPGVIGIGVLILLLLSGITICSQTIRATYTNPIDNLKSE